MESALELMAGSKILSLGSNTLEVIGVVLEANLGDKKLVKVQLPDAPVLGLVRLGETSYLVASAHEILVETKKTLPSKPAV